MKNRIADLTGIIFLVFALFMGYAFLGCDNGTTNNNSITPHSHSYSAVWSFDTTKHWHECSCGDKNDVANHLDNPCSVCGYNDNSHTHNFNTSWEKDTNYHWRECECGDATDIGNHSGNPCTVCGYDSSTHTHSFSTSWSFSATEHWHVCECGEKEDISNHSGNPCTVCGYNENEFPGKILTIINFPVEKYNVTTFNVEIYTVFTGTVAIGTATEVAETMVINFYTPEGNPWEVSTRNYRVKWVEKNWCYDKMSFIPFDEKNTIIDGSLF